MSLARFPMDASRSRGRRWTEAPHPYRNAYARDRDRVIHSRAFRRLEAKTQVFTTRYSDHFRNRLTHTLEVAQVARTVADALHLNTDLAESLALAHDIGHPPFGHAGEKQLDRRMRACGDRFNHTPPARMRRSSCFSPAWPKGGWPMSWTSASDSARSVFRCRAPATVRATCATSRVWVRRLRK